MESGKSITRSTSGQHFIAYDRAKSITPELICPASLRNRGRPRELRHGKPDFFRAADKHVILGLRLRFANVQRVGHSSFPTPSYKMVSSIRIFTSTTSLAYRSRIISSSSSQIPICFRPASRRSITADEKPLPKAEGSGPGPNQEQAPHVSEEAADLAKVVGETAPDIGQGTPVQEVYQCGYLEIELESSTMSRSSNAMVVVKTRHLKS